MWFTLKAIVDQIAPITTIYFCHDISGDKHLPVCDVSLYYSIYECLIA